MDQRETRATGSVGGIGERQRERIIRAATGVFSRKGYDGARVDEIAREAGLPKGNVLYYFKTKKDLYRVVIEQVLDLWLCLLYTSPSPRDATLSRMPSSA